MWKFRNEILASKSLLEDILVTLALRIWPSPALSTKKGEILDEEFEKMDSTKYSYTLFLKEITWL